MSLASEKAAFYAELATLLGGGVPLGTSLESLERHARLPRFKVVTKGLRAACADGVPLADAMERHPEIFEMFEVCVVRAGDQAGRLPEILRPLSAEWERSDRGRRRVRSALGYPALLLHVAALAGAVPIAVSQGAPAFVRAVVLTLGIMYAIGFGLLLLTSRTAIRRAEPFWLRVPVVGPHLKNTWIERFVLVLRLQVESGALYSEALPQALLASGSVSLERAAPEARAAAERGDSIVDALAPVFVFAPELASFFATAETSGRLAEVLTFVESRVGERREQSAALLVEWVPRLIYLAALGWGAWTVIHLVLGYVAQINEAINANY